ncbi:uncharacterized protein [Musca autumnalis]|uniref:uncharacterized protein n=1 Tax=Musca autumnalis TaxID=221902 RepID=UPI003CEF9BF1
MQKENDVLKLVAVNNNNNSGAQLTDNNISLSMVSNFLPTFDGSTDAAFWVTQLQDLQKVYKLSDDMVRALLAMKLVGKPLNWLHSRRNTVTESVAEIFSQFCLMFGTNESKMEMRKKFERRTWRFDENLTDYCNDKTKIAEKLKFEDDELIEYIIDGIPNMQLRRQTVMQRFLSVNELCKSLAAIKLPKANSESRDAAATKLDVRCYNCNSMGHYAADCNKPRRQPGTCYACGRAGHTVGQCDKNKKKDVSTSENNYKL